MTDFEIMDKMAAENMDIAMCPDLIQIDKTNKGGLATFGVPHVVFNKIAGIVDGAKDYYVAMYIINKEQFDAIKATNP